MSLTCFFLLKEKLKKEGFMDTATLPSKQRECFYRYLTTDPDLYASVGIVRPYNRRGKKYSSTHLFGRQIRIYYLRWATDKVSTYLRDLFLKTNPNPDRPMRRVYTRFMHDANLDPKLPENSNNRKGSRHGKKG